jgi:branched-chain amino acid aminotransferase
MSDKADDLSKQIGVPSSERPRFPPGVAYIEGQYMPVSEAKISVLDWGLLRSDATYDVVHVWNGRFFRLDTHLDRFFSSVEKLRMKLPTDRAALTDILRQCVRRSGLRDAYVEMICTRGNSPTFNRDPRQAVNRLICFAIPFGWIANEEQRERGLSIAISKIMRIPPGSVDPTVKNYHWLDLVMALYEGYDRGAENVVLLNERGEITEGPGFNVFAVMNQKVVTPVDGVLEGITRRSVLDICKELGIPADETSLPSEWLRAADEVFVTSTAGGVMPVTQIDGQAVGAGKVGPLTRRISDRYWARHEDPEWSVAV